MKKKIICLSCLTVILAAFSACGTVENAPSETEAEAVIETTSAEMRETVASTTKAKTSAPAKSATRVTTEAAPAVSDVSDFETSAVDGGVEITKYNGSAAVVNVPEEIDGKAVVSIGTFAFSMHEEITEIVFPESLIQIKGGFLGCTGLETIAIPESVKEIYPYAFQGCSSLEEIMLPKNVINIGMGAFLGCEDLKSIEVDPLNIFYYSVDGVLFKREYSTLHTFPAGKTDVSYTVPEGTEIILNDAFYGCGGLTGIVLPQSVREIGESAFCECDGLVEIELPRGVEKINTQTFLGCTSLASISMEGVCYIDYGAFFSCSSLADVNLPDSVWHIDESAFAGCEKLRAVYKGTTYTYEEMNALFAALTT